ncbi:hypothetical protein LCGC14_1017650 [marine sediment metagenome]|uniref:Uncharacterized protein n=1 Tax=marine sediment metagenome TaxID=412755 RepID=A0A0F9R4G2_9ZZZZ
MDGGASLTVRPFWYDRNPSYGSISGENLITGIYASTIVVFRTVPAGRTLLLHSIDLLLIFDVATTLFRSAIIGVGITPPMVHTNLILSCRTNDETVGSELHRTASPQLLISAGETLYLGFEKTSALGDAFYSGAAFYTEFDA